MMNKYLESNGIDTSVSLDAHEGPVNRAESMNMGQEDTNKVQARIEAKTVQFPVKYRGTYKKAMTGKSLRAAVNAFCLECVFWQREEVKLCTSPTCPLYPYRPYKNRDLSRAT